MPTHRGGHDQPTEFRRPIHRIAQAQIRMANGLAQRMRVALVAVHLEIVMRRLGRAVLADYHRGRGDTGGGYFLGAKQVDRARPIPHVAAKGARRTRQRIAQVARVGRKVDRVELAREAKELPMVARTGLADQEAGGVHKVSLTSHVNSVISPSMQLWPPYQCALI